MCDSCANAKARQKDVPKISTGEQATVINGRWFNDSSTLKVHKGVKSSNTIGISLLMNSQESHFLEFTTRKMSSLRACADKFKHRQPAVTLS